MSSAGGSQKRRKALVQKESADTQEHESCQLNDMEVDSFREQGRVVFHPKCGEQFGWMACTHVHV